MTVNPLRGEDVLASDGPVGSLHDVYFDDEGWTVRYFLVDTGECLPGGLLLVPPGALAADVALERGMRLALTRERASSRSASAASTSRSASSS